MLPQTKEKLLSLLFRDFFTYRGRITRSQYFFYQTFYTTILVFILVIILGIISSLLNYFYGLIIAGNVAGDGNTPHKITTNYIENIFTFLMLTGMIIISSFSNVRRFHDLNLPGSRFLLLAIPPFNFYYGFLLLLIAGTLGPNKYGEDPIQYKTLKEINQNGLQFHTPPKWDSWYRYIALLFILFAFFCIYQIPFMKIHESIINREFSSFDILLLWPTLPALIFLWIGWFNFIGLWDYANRVVIENNKATFYLLGFLGKEKKTLVMDTVKAFKSNWIVGMVNGKEEECFMKRKYLSPELQNELAKIGK
jgi:uncharacterized membrane protein YhaH (DUF805 family)